MQEKEIIERVYMMRNIEKYRNAFINALDLEEDEVCEDLALGVTREWDSIGHMTLISEIEDVFDVSIDSEWITEFNSYQSGMELLKRLGVDFINE
jgi:acyl carrier protein